MPLIRLIVCLAALWSAWPAAAQEPIQLGLTGESRGRFEILDGQFRANRSGSDQLLLFRSLLHGTADTGPVTFGVEFQDSRTYLGDEGTPLSSSFTNALDVLQLYTRFDDFGRLLPDDWRANLKLGRQTVSILSKRQIERVDYANVIKSYTGAHLTAKKERGDELHLFHVVPTARFPNNRAAIDNNELASDREQWNRHIFGVHYKRAEVAKRIPGLSAEVFVYGVQESDDDEFQTPNRSYLAPGFRIFRRRARGRWDVDVEGAYRFGERRATSDPLDTEDLDVSSWMLLARLGYTFESAWSPRIALQYYSTTGDDDPDDDQFDQFERLFGGRRTDLNNTSIHGPLTPANLTALGVRIDVKPSERWDARLHYSAAYLESATDSWVIARLRDRSGQSGNFIGHTLDSRARFWFVPDVLQLEIGASALVFGEFAKSVPNGPTGSRTLFAYSQLNYYLR